MFGNTNAAFEYFSDSSAITCTAVGAITGKTFVVLVAGGDPQRPQVSTAPAGSRPYGVAAWDVADGESVTIIRRGVISVTADAALTPGPVAVGAGGRAAAAAAAPAHYAGFVHSDTAVGADAPVALSI